MFGLGKKEKKQNVTTEDTVINFTADTANPTANANIVTAATTVTTDKCVTGVQISDGLENVTAPDGELVIDEERMKAQAEDEPAPLTQKEAKALKRSRYQNEIANNNRFKKAYVIRNKKTNQVVELRAASSLHACKIIGWRPRRVQVLATRDISMPIPETMGDKLVEPQTVNSSSNS